MRKPKDLHISRSPDTGKETLDASALFDEGRMVIEIDPGYYQFIAMSYEQLERLHQWIIEVRRYALSKGMRPE